MRINLSQSEVFVILMELARQFDKNEVLITKIINQMEVPKEDKKLFWDRFLYIYKKIFKDEKNE